MSQEEKSIVVLPFEDFSPDKENEYFSDGLTEEIIAELSKVKKLRVISRTSSMMLKGAQKDVRTISQELDVDYVLEGSVRRSGNALRIVAQLNDARRDAHVWAGKYNGILGEVFDIQDRVSRSIVDALSLKLSPEEKQRMAERPIDDVHAYECYLRARQEVFGSTEDALARALQHLRNGLDVIGENALLYAGMAYVYWQYVNVGLRQEDYVTKAEQYVEKAFGLDPHLPEGHLLLGVINQAFWGNQQEGVCHLKRALAADSNKPDALAWLSLGYCIVGKPSAAIPTAERLLKIDPLNPTTHCLQGIIKFYEGKFPLAAEPMYRAHSMNPQNPAHLLWYAMSLAYCKRLEEAYRFIDQAAESSPDHFYTKVGLIMKCALSGSKEEAEDLITADVLRTARRDPMYSYWLGIVQVTMGEKEKAFDWFKTAFERGFINYPFISEYDPFLESIRGEEEFKILVKAVKEEWERFEI